ncbi:uncharacterized protein LAESUDRAFT_213229 [Laetiporus sulphureus 93-53]|uniref:Uncharacterized protein n=1 Tax=Laetiporus sulphureus 93-53 TaxID=1314785 RepID=A0A165DW39_9APHY|nr:uncharacterized protein LAESUDRAFT_213229 [Laetiporus sulphureus 93-53]KZT05748.1 hypothetical protein LAESUDRAFT_213229 [Laetiporus sulphureus 93-53]
MKRGCSSWGEARSTAACVGGARDLEERSVFWANDQCGNASRRDAIDLNRCISMPLRRWVAYDEMVPVMKSINICRVRTSGRYGMRDTGWCAGFVSGCTCA